LKGGDVPSPQVAVESIVKFPEGVYEVVVWIAANKYRYVVKDVQQFNRLMKYTPGKAINVLKRDCLSWDKESTNKQK
jgi:hypothetical protein